MSISGLDSMALGLTVYASQGGSPLHHARLVSGCWPSSAGRDSLTRRAATKGFCVRVTSSFLELCLTQRHPCSPRGHELSQRRAGEPFRGVLDMG